MKGILQLYINMLRELGYDSVRQFKLRVTKEDMKAYGIRPDQHKLQHVRKALQYLENEGRSLIQDEVLRSSRYIPTEVRHIVWIRDNGICVCCGGNESLEFDHIIPWSKGGSNSIKNIQILCQSCNKEKRDKI